MYQPCMFVCGWWCRCINHVCLCVDGGVDVSTMYAFLFMCLCVCFMYDVNSAGLAAVTGTR